MQLTANNSKSISLKSRNIKDNTATRKKIKKDDILKTLKTLQKEEFSLTFQGANKRDLHYLIRF